MNPPPPDDTLLDGLRELEALLNTSHDTSVFETLQGFAARLKKQRQSFFGAPGALLSRPIDCQTAREQGVWPQTEDDFRLLQGDVIYTGSAYFMGGRLESGYFAAANATCDLVPDRREYVLLLPVRAICICRLFPAMSQALSRDLLILTAWLRLMPLMWSLPKGSRL